jgi:signal transduction histidine kinase
LEDVADIRRNTVGLREKAGWAINPDGLHHIHQLEEAAQDAAQRLEGWFDYQMAMTRDLHYAAVDLSMIAKETSDICKSEFDRVGAVLTIRDLPMIEADPDLLHMMFRNLYDFTLAQKLVGQPPQILVRATIVRAPEKSASPGWCQLSIEFDGPATTEAELEHLFQAGTKPDETVPGGGLGLLTVRRIAERHGGTVSAQPKEGSGVSLIVVLPLLAPKSW